MSHYRSPRTSWSNRAAALAFGLMCVCTQSRAAPQGWTLHLVWSPDYCEAKLSSKEAQCTEERYFTVDGLLPHFDGEKPACTDQRLSDEEAERWLTTIPNRAQIRKTWKRQGACSGLDSAGYYTQLERGSRRVLVPSEFTAVSAALHTSAEMVKAAFIRDNPGLSVEAIVLDCHGRSLAGLSVCFDAGFQYQACSVAASCSADELIVKPLRSSRVGREPVYR
ncbi:MAG: hypothetical protein JWQ90_4459 [Hydrocarboniphaga sp.]|uniref:hypothetical protein n=1 Tax=Hydrocarboniphaga sp. TaxID=2033016 RepID=UPI0026167B20|nr:hypothetical protein [Hydrocarboniphaga sp.]MDB5972009.1 hypothetical protein [Hydrocarboniphaga sp.]